MSGKPADRARVTTVVPVAPDEAFDVFTRDIGLWWKTGPRFRFDGAGDARPRFEGGSGGRLVGGEGADLFEVGRILAWERPARLVVEWRTRAFAPHERTEVEVRFEPQGEGTRVTLEHRGWAAIPPEHRVRHGLEGQAFTDMIGLWWSELATALRAHASRRTPEEPGTASSTVR